MLHNRIIRSEEEHIYQHRLQLARQVINEIIIEVPIEVKKGKEIVIEIKKVAAYEHLKGEGKQDKGYRPIEMILSNEDQKQKLVESIIGEIETLQDKVTNLSSIAVSYLRKAIDELKKESFKLEKKKKIS